jgi:fatty-acyl-CoA synthase
MLMKKDKDGLLVNANTIGELLDRNAEIYPNKEAIVFCEQNLRCTWKELKKICDQIAKGFLILGVKKHDHIAIWATNVPEWIFTQLAAAKIGAAIVTMNPEWKADEVEYALKQSDAHTLIAIEGFSKTIGKNELRYDYLSTLNELYPELANSKAGKLKLKKTPTLKNIILISDKTNSGIIRWKDFATMGTKKTNDLLALYFNQPLEQLVIQNAQC